MDNNYKDEGSCLYRPIDVCVDKLYTTSVMLFHILFLLQRPRVPVVGRPIIPLG